MCYHRGEVKNMNEYPEYSDDLEPSEEDFLVPDVEVDYPVLRTLARVLLGSLAISAAMNAVPRRLVRKAMNGRKQ